MASVACDAGNGTMTVSAQTTPMQAYGFAGPTTGPYDGGQWVRYNVFARDIEVSTWTPVYTWSAWQWVPGAVSTMYVERLTVPADLGSNVVDGFSGHNYAVLVQIDYWTGAENIGNVEPEYTQTYQAMRSTPTPCTRLLPSLSLATDWVFPPHVGGRYSLRMAE